MKTEEIAILSDDLERAKECGSTDSEELAQIVKRGQIKLKEVDEEQGREDERMREIESAERSSDAYERSGEDLRDY